MPHERRRRITSIKYARLWAPLRLLHSVVAFATPFTVSAKGELSPDGKTWIETVTVENTTDTDYKNLFITSWPYNDKGWKTSTSPF